MLVDLHVPKGQVLLSQIQMQERGRQIAVGWFNAALVVGRCCQGRVCCSALTYSWSLWMYMGFFLCFWRPFLLFESSDGDVNAITLATMCYMRTKTLEIKGATVYFHVMNTLRNKYESYCYWLG